jgi:hypothetical protein
MWKQKIYKFLEINKIAFEFIENKSFFDLFYLPQHQLFLHLIDTKTFQENSLPSSYFQTLSDSYNAENQRIIHLWEDVFTNKKILVEARILTMIGKFKRLHARHCYIERIDKPTADKFLDDNHLQGSVKAKFKYGLFLKPQYNEKYLADYSNKQRLVAVATFSGGRLMTEESRQGQRSYELLRFASLCGYTVMGGMDKLLKAFASEHNPDDIMTYADRDWSDGRSYKILGFEKVETSEPQSLLLDIQNFKRYSMKENGENLMQIFNAGSIKFIRKNEKIFL